MCIRDSHRTGLHRAAARRSEWRQGKAQHDEVMLKLPPAVLAAFHVGHEARAQNRDVKIQAARRAAVRWRVGSREVPIAERNLELALFRRRMRQGLPMKPAAKFRAIDDEFRRVNRILAQARRCLLYTSRCV